jgi:hypothetical protein
MCLAADGQCCWGVLSLCLCLQKSRVLWVLALHAWASTTFSFLQSGRVLSEELKRHSKQSSYAQDVEHQMGPCILLTPIQ